MPVDAFGHVRRTRCIVRARRRSALPYVALPLHVDNHCTTSSSLLVTIVAGRQRPGSALAAGVVLAYRYRHRPSGALHELDIALQVLPIGRVVDAGLREWHGVRT